MESKAFDVTNHDPDWEGAARKGVAGLELEAVHLRGRVAELERIVKAQEDELGKLRERDGLTFRERLILDAWPRFDDGVPVGLGDTVEGIGGEVRMIEVLSGSIDLVGANGHLHLVFGERVKRPAPEVLDADGVPIKVGDTVYMLDGDWCDALPCIGICGGDKMRVSALISPHGDGRLTCFKNKFICYPKPSQLTHREPDSWEKLFGEASVGACCYFGRVDKDGTERCEGCPAEQAGCCTSTQMEDLIRRAKKLAGVE